MYNINIDDMFTLIDKKYVTIDKINYDNIDYLFTNRLDFDSEEPTKDFVVFKCLEKGLVEEKNQEKLKYLLGKFSESVNDKLANYYQINIKGE